MGRRTDESLYSLPETSQASKKAAKELELLLAEAHSIKRAQAREKAVKARILELLQQEGLAGENNLGARVGNLCVIASYAAGRKSLSKELLIDNGVSPETIAASMVEGKSSWRVELPEIGANDKENGSGSGED